MLNKIYNEIKSQEKCIKITGWAICAENNTVDRLLMFISLNRWVGGASKKTKQKGGIKRVSREF